MVNKKIQKNLDYDEETLKDKLKKKVGALTLIGTGILSILHVLSHVVPAIGIFGLFLSSDNSKIYKILSNEYLQFAYVGFVVLSFWYIYRDHKHHKHEKELREQLQRKENQINKLKKSLKQK